MKTLTLDDMALHWEKHQTFKPFIRRPMQLRDGMFMPEPEDHWSTRPTMFSTKLGDRVHFRHGELTVWAGYNGHKKSMFLGQLVADLLVQRHPVFCLSMEMTPTVTLERLARQMSGVAKPSQTWLDRFATWSDRLFLLDYQGRMDPQMCMAACVWLRNTLFTPPHIIIDSMMMVCESEEHLDGQKQLITDLVRFAKESDSHVHLVAHCRKPMRGGEDEVPTKYEIRGSSAITDQADNVIIVWSNKDKARRLEDDPTDSKALSQPDVVIGVDKQRNGRWEGRAKLWHDEASLRFVNDPTSPVEPYALVDPPTGLWPQE